MWNADGVKCKRLLTNSFACLDDRSLLWNTNRKHLFLSYYTVDLKVLRNFLVLTIIMQMYIVYLVVSVCCVAVQFRARKNDSSKLCNWQEMFQNIYNI